MRTSEQVNEILPALLVLQRDMPVVGKDSENPHFKNKYTSFESLLSEVIRLGNPLGLFVSQGTDTSADASAMVVVTRIFHAASGQWIETGIRLPLEKPTSQAAGSAQSYGMRYTLKALAGIRCGDEDDDGTVASAFHQEFEPVKRSAPRPAPSGSIPSKCPTCGSKVYDNRPKKATGEYKPKSPDWSCSSKECKGDKGYRTGGWVEKDQADSDSQDHAPLDEEGGY